MQNHKTTTIPLWVVEFSDVYDVPPVITDALEDTSYHNDIAPSFGLKGANRLQCYAALFCDHPDVAMREITGEDCVSRYFVFIGGNSLDLPHLWQGDDAAEAVKQTEQADKALRLARCFAARLTKALSPLQMASTIRRNAIETDMNVCHSHDFIDSNMVMADAFNLVFGHPIDLQDDEQRTIWGNAWNIAKKADFNAEEL